MIENKGYVTRRGMVQLNYFIKQIWQLTSLSFYPTLDTTVWPNDGILRLLRWLLGDTEAWRWHEVLQITACELDLCCLLLAEMIEYWKISSLTGKKPTFHGVDFGFKEQVFKALYMPVLTHLCKIIDNEWEKWERLQNRKICANRWNNATGEWKKKKGETNIERKKKRKRNYFFLPLIFVLVLSVFLLFSIFLHFLTLTLPPHRRIFFMFSQLGTEQDSCLKWNVLLPSHSKKSLKEISVWQRRERRPAFYVIQYWFNTEREKFSEVV